jgi:predicted nucleic acid-binding protein
MRSGWSDILVDSNLLVYAFDPRDKQKQDTAIALLDDLLAAGRAVLSVQCLSEFFNAVTRKLPDPLPSASALLELDRFTRTYRVLDLTAAAILEGCRAANDYSLSVWDGLLWAVAKLNRVPYILTEDMQHDQLLEGVRFQNPFVAGFDLGLLA